MLDAWNLWQIVPHCAKKVTHLGPVLARAPSKKMHGLRTSAAQVSVRRQFEDNNSLLCSGVAIPVQRMDRSGISRLGVLQ